MIAGANILILEDEPIIGLALEDMLEREGAAVLYAERIEEAEMLLETERVDAAILDVNVHGTMSYGFAALLKKRAIPFIFATGYGEHSHPAEFAGILTVSKPCTADDVKAALLSSRA